MSRRNNPDRCVTCRMHATLCICGLVPRLAARCLARSSVTIVGERDQPVRLPAMADDEQPVLLFPGDDAIPIARFAGTGRPVLLVVPDGTWRQASKLGR